MNGARLWQQFGPAASKEYAAVLFHNRNKGLSGRRNWIRATRILALPLSLDSHALRALPRPLPSESNLALENREPPPATTRAPVAIPTSPATLSVPFPGRPARPFENKDPLQSPSGKGGNRPHKKQPPPIFDKGRSSGGPSKAAQSFQTVLLPCSP